MRIHKSERVEAWLDGIKVDSTLTLNGGIKRLLLSVQSMIQCKGVTEADLQDVADVCGEGHYRIISRLENNELKSVVRSRKCAGVRVVGSSKLLLCNQCRATRKTLEKRKSRRVKSEQTTDISAKTPLERVAKAKLISALKVQRQTTKDLEQKIRKIQNDIKTDGVQLSQSMHNSLMEVFTQKENDIDSEFHKMFWAEQKKNFGRKKKSRRWHPSMIKLALTLHSQSPAAYRTLLDTGLLALPGETTLHDYTNYIAPKQGFQKEVWMETQ